jgi:hypothetical protein
MNYKAIGYEGPKIELNELKWDTQSQKVILQLDTPVIGKINSNTLGICNNERFNIIDIKGEIITIQNDYKTKEVNAVENSTFQRYFRVGYGGTCHSNQGLTINKPYLIHQWDRYNDNMKYVALSRSTDYNNINIRVSRSSVDGMKQKQLNKQLKHAKLSELENDANIMNDYDTAYYNYYDESKLNEIYTDTHKSRKQMLLSKLKCVHCQSNYFNNGVFINYNNCTFLCTSCYTKLNEEEES